MRKVIDSFTERENKRIEEMRYREYIVNHINNVKSSYNLLFKPFMTDLQGSKDNIISTYTNLEILEACRIARENIEFHDRSKYFEEEFEGYRYKYFPTFQEELYDDYKEKAEREMARAWEHHYTHNPHHPEYWGRKQDMPLEYIIEMICDWQGMSIHFNSSLRKWWKEHEVKKHKVMTDRTFNTVVELLGNLIVLDVIG